MKKGLAVLLCCMLLLSGLLTTCSANTATSLMIPVSVTTSDGIFGYRYSYDESTKMLTVTDISTNAGENVPIPRFDGMDHLWLTPLLEIDSRQNAQILLLALAIPGPENHAYFDEAYLLSHSHLVTSGMVRSIRYIGKYFEPSYAFTVENGRVTNVNGKEVKYSGFETIFRIGDTKEEARYRYTADGMYQSGTSPCFDGEPDTKSLPTTFDTQGRMVSLLSSAGFQTQPTYQYHYTGTSFFPDRYTVSDNPEDGLLWTADVTCAFSNGHLKSVTSNEHYKEDATVDETFPFLWNYIYEEPAPNNSPLEKASLWIQRLFHRK